MSVIYAEPTVTLKSVIQEIAPEHFWRDPFGLISGYRAYLVYSYLDGKTDEELLALGIDRGDVPRVASEVIFKGPTAKA